METRSKAALVGAARHKAQEFMTLPAKLRPHLEIWSVTSVVPKTGAVDVHENVGNTSVELDSSNTELDDKIRNSTLALSQETSTTI